MNVWRKKEALYGFSPELYQTVFWYLCIPNHVVFTVTRTLRSNCQGLTRMSLLPPTVDTTYCDVIIITCLKTSQFILFGTGNSDVQKPPIWDLESIGCDVDEVEVNTVSTTRCPVHGNIHNSNDIFRESLTGEGGDQGRA